MARGREVKAVGFGWLCFSSFLFFYMSILAF